LAAKKTHYLIVTFKFVMIKTKYFYYFGDYG